MPPFSLTILKYAVSALPIIPYDDAWPLYGIDWPILISVAVTPGVSEPPFLQPAARITQTAVNAANCSAVVMTNQFRFSMYPPFGDSGEKPGQVLGRCVARSAIRRSTERT